VNLGTIAAGDTNFTWGGTFALPGVSSATVPHNLTAYDYDDEWGNSPPGYTNPGCTVTTGLCSLVGNFSLTFTATISGGAFDGSPVFSVFSPHSNHTGGFVGFEGLDPTGLSETSFDAHVGSVTGTLATIDIGVPPPPGVPEPASWGLMILGFFGLGGLVRGRKTAAAV
jgi:hypothetical protein